MGKREKDNQAKPKNKNSKFYIVEATRAMDGTMIPNNAILLANKDQPRRIVFNNNYYYFVTDLGGKVLLPINRRSQRMENAISECVIDYVNGTKLVITSKANASVAIDTQYICNDPRHLSKRVIFDYRKGGRLADIEVPNPDKEVIILRRYNKGTKEMDSRLFSIKRGKFISPSFTTLTKDKKTGNDILRFDDEVYSNKEVDGRRHHTTLTGFITLDGIIGNTVYDSDLNKPRDIGLKAGKIMEAYKAFRSRIKQELDYKFEIEKQNALRKENFSRNQIFQLSKRVSREK